MSTRSRVEPPPAPPAEVCLPTRLGKLVLREYAGPCVLLGCGKRGGGMVWIQEHVSDELSLPDAAWQGKAVVICGDHLSEVLSAVLSLPDE